MKTKPFRNLIWIMVAFILIPLPMLAFPPAPHHVIYGMVRDELGNPIVAENAELIFETSAGVKLTTVIAYKGEPGQNYTLDVPMDSGITSDAYMPTAMRPTVPFKIRVRIAGVIYLPIEMTGDYAQLGQPGKKTRLNLTLGEDSDGDGLPDAWERNLIAALGLNKTLADITPTGDADGDGMSNLDEYLTGTYAFDKEDGYALKIKTMHGDLAVLEFTAIRGRTYTIHSSSDLIHWTQIPFRVLSTSTDTPAPFTLTWYASDVTLMQIEAESGSDPASVHFFKLMIE